VPSFKKHQRKIPEVALPGSQDRHRQSEAIADALREADYVQIGLDHFALPHDPLVVAQRNGLLHRNFQGYTDDRGDVLLGFGASAIGRLPQGYVQNILPTREYLERIASGRLATTKGYALTSDDQFRAEIIERIMCDFAVDLDDVCRRHGRRRETLSSDVARLSSLVSDGVVALKNGKLKVEDDSRFLVRTVASTFDAHIGRSAAIHSRAV
jgi:oxygen-independent coproporphyrinogen-3 oxidase